MWFCQPITQSQLCLPSNHSRPGVSLQFIPLSGWTTSWVATMLSPGREYSFINPPCSSEWRSGSVHKARWHFCHLARHCPDDFQGLSKAFHYHIQLIIFYLLLWNYLLILKMLTETLLNISFSVIVQCFLVPTSPWLQEKCVGINLSPTAFGIILQNHRRLPVSIFSIKIAALGSLKRVTGRIFKISK